MSEEIERVELKVNVSPIWESIVALAGYTYEPIRHTFDQDDEWKSDTMPSELEAAVAEIGRTNFWHALLMLQDQIEASTVQDFSNRLTELTEAELYDSVLPYKGRRWEGERIQAARSIEARQNYSSYFQGHPFLESYFNALEEYSVEQFKSFLIHTLTSWTAWVETKSEWTNGLAILQKEQQSIELDPANPVKDIERITGVAYVPEPGVWTVKLIPHIAYRPWLLEKRSIETKLFFYPVSDEYFQEQGVPSSELVRGHKALGDSLRLQLLYQLKQGPMSLADLSKLFQVSKTTLHHQLSTLKAAKFVAVNKGVYVLNQARLEGFSTKLQRFLEEK